MAAAAGQYAFVLLMVLSSLPFVFPDDHLVGANHGWQVPAESGVNLNYTQWAANITFYLHDYISFHYQEHMHTVFEVNYSTYMDCSFSVDKGHEWIHNWTTKGGRTQVPLNEMRSYYFACGIGSHCLAGMKVPVHVASIRPPPPPPPKG